MKYQHVIRNFFILPLCFMAVSAYLTSTARADCDLGFGNGTRPVGKVVYNTNYQALQICKEDNVWYALGRINCPAGDGCGAAGPTGCPSIGDTCSDGSYYIGQVGGVDIYATAVTSESTNDTWNNGTTNWTATGFVNMADGSSNTSGLVAMSDAGSPYAAAVYCDGLTGVHGHSDWYLPAKDELTLFWNGGAPVADILVDGTWYWSSTERIDRDAWVQNFLDGSQNGFFNKNYSFGAVRCVRR